MINPAAIGALAKGDIDNFLVASTPGGIEAQEAAGQKELVSNFTRLPLQMREKEIEVAIKYGFVLGEPIDEVFRAVTAPEGWSLRPTEHSMHSDILDADGAIRGGFFYKAAFYDRRASVTWVPRYTVEVRYNDDGETVSVFGFDAQNKEAVTEVFTTPKRDYDARDVAYGQISEKLGELFPEWQDATAYWNA